MSPIRFDDDKGRCAPCTVKRKTRDLSSPHQPPARTYHVHHCCDVPAQQTDTPEHIELALVPGILCKRYGPPPGSHSSPSASRWTANHTLRHDVEGADTRDPGDMLGK
jgi:hypothetical protein